MNREQEIAFENEIEMLAKIAFDSGISVLPEDFEIVAKKYDVEYAEVRGYFFECLGEYESWKAEYNMGF